MREKACAAIVYSYTLWGSNFHIVRIKVEFSTILYRILQFKLRNTKWANNKTDNGAKLHMRNEHTTYQNMA